MKRIMDCSPGRTALLAGLCLGTIVATTQRTFSQTFFVSIEPPGVAFQQSPLVVSGQNYGAAGVEVENFDRLAPGPADLQF
jgi:hypothetical protein